MFARKLDASVLNSVKLMAALDARLGALERREVPAPEFAF